MSESTGAVEASFCTGKAVFRTKAEAFRALQDQLRRRRSFRRNIGGQLRPYRCPSCHQFHLGS